MYRPIESESASSTLDLCCGGKKCPKLDDVGDAIVVSDPEQSPLPIAIAKTDIPRVIAYLAARAAR